VAGPWEDSVSEIRVAQTFWHLLARAWSAVALFHPLVQERGREWEEALIAALPAAEAVAGEPLVSPGQTRVLGALVATLDDNATRLVAGPPAADRDAPGEGPAIAGETLVGNIARVRVRRWSDFRIAPGYFTEWHDAIRALNEAIEGAAAAGAAGLVLDFRETRGDRSEDAERGVIYGRMRAELLARLVRAPVAPPGLARVQRVGYHDPREPAGAVGAYATEWVTAAGGAVTPVAGAFAGPLAILTARDTSPLLEPALILLQRTGRAVCVGEQSLAYHPQDQVVALAEGLALQLRRRVAVWQGRPARYAPDVPADDALATALAILSGRAHPRPPGRGHEPVSPPAPHAPGDGAGGDALPSRAERLFAVIKLWTAMRTFYAYREHLADWDAALPAAIAEVAGARTRESYFGACQRLSSRCKGGHNFVLFRRGEGWRFASRPNGFAPRVRLGCPRGAVVVLGPAAPDSPARPGDLLEAVDGEPVPDRQARLQPLFAHYPPGARDHYLLQALLDAPEGARVLLRLRGGDGARREVATVADAPVEFVTEPAAVATLPPWGLLPGELARIGYLDASRIDLQRLDAALAALVPAAALIVDLRRYPTLPNPLRSLRRFMRDPVPWPPQRRPVLAGPEEGVFGWLENRFYPADVIPPADPADGRPLAALIGGGTVSLGEDWASLLRGACRATLVGGVTAGGVGANAFVMLPGGGRASFSGSAVPETGAGRTIEGDGLVPDIAVVPTPDDDGDAAVAAAARALLERLG
jgi:C-terminal processing protease CtpA/Prc